METSRESKRLLSWILSLALVFSVLGIHAGAAKATTGSERAGAASGEAISGGAVEGEVIPEVKGKIQFMDDAGELHAATGSAIVRLQSDRHDVSLPEDGDGTFTLTDVPEGEYTISVEWQNRELEKEQINLTAASNTPETNSQLKFVLSPKQKTVIEAQTDIGANVDDESMAKQFLATPATQDEYGITQDDLGKAGVGTHELFLTMAVRDYDITSSGTVNGITVAHRTEVQDRAASDGNSILEYYSVRLTKRLQTVAVQGGSAETYTLTRSNDLIKIQIPLKDSSLGKSRYIVYRHHEGNVETVGMTPNEKGEYIEVDQSKKMLTLHVKNYCLYVLANLRASGPIWYPQPVATQTAEPTAEPTKEPEVTAEPTTEPTVEPTAEPTKEPEATVEPTQEPQATEEPTAEPEKVVVKKLLLEATKITSTSTKLVWETLPDADGYDLYQSKCNTDTKTYTVKYAKTFKSGEKHTYLLKGLKKGTWYKNRIYAWKMIDGKKVIIGKSLIVHHYHKKKNDKSKWGNPTGIKLSKTKLSIAKGKTAKLTAKALASGKDMGRHGKRIRYVVSDTAIASVSENGKVKGRKKGTCTVYVVAQSGLKKKVKVTVK